MARERYLLNDTEDTIHQNQIKPTTGKEKRENWWFYHKVHLIVGVIAVVFAVAIVWSFVSKDNPDYNVAIMTEYVLPTDLQLDLEEHIEQYADDRNGDGEVMVQLLYYTFPTGGTSDYDIAQLQASFVKFAADANAGDTMIFLYDDASYNYLDQNDMDGFFGPVDDSGELRALFGHGGAGQSAAQPLCGGGRSGNRDECARQPEGGRPFNGRFGIREGGDRRVQAGQHRAV